jgi:hypothetical protein
MYVLYSLSSSRMRLFSVLQSSPSAESTTKVLPISNNVYIFFYYQDQGSSDMR